MKYEFISRYGVEPFSLADVSVSTAREFISFLIDFCLEWHIPCPGLTIEHLGGCVPIPLQMPGN